MVVEDEEPIADILEYNLSREGYSVTLVHNGGEAVDRVRHEDPDLIILDIMLPERDGFSVCREVRSFSSVPILMLTAKQEEIDKVLGLELGADDYVVKPFSPREVVARVKALLRRAQGCLGPGGNNNKIISCGEITIDLNTFQAYRNGQDLGLTQREFELLKFLASSPGQVFSREALLEKVWGYEFYGDIRTVDVTVRRLREKIEDDPSQPRYLQTRRGIGYYCQAS